MKKLLISDYDNTFFTDEVSVLKNIEAVNKFRYKGNIFVIATSRSYISIIEEIKKYNICYDYIFTNLGAAIFDNNCNILYSHYIQQKDKVIIENILKGYLLLNITRFGVIENQDENSDSVIGYKIKGDIEALEILKNRFELILNNFDILLKREENKLFLNEKLNTKENAIEMLLKLFPEYNNYKIITVGDDDVDLNMLKMHDGYRMAKSSKNIVSNIYKIVSSVYELINY